MPRATFISQYLTRRMRKCNLPYGMAYLNLLADTEDRAVNAWKLYKLKLKI